MRINRPIGYRALLTVALLLILAPLRAHPANSSAGLIMATYLGGGGADYGRAVALDRQGNIYVAGDGFSGSILGQRLSSRGGEEIIVVKLSPDARQLLGIFSVGSTTTDRLGGMAVTPQGEVVLSIDTDNPSFPTMGALQPAPDDDNSGVLLKINAALDGLVFSTFTPFTIDYGQQSVGVDGAGTIAVVGYRYDPLIKGRELMLQKYSPDGQRVLFTRVWDGDQRDERPAALVVQPDGTTLIAGTTSGKLDDLMVTEHAVQKVCGRKLALGDDLQCDQDAFIIRLDPAGTVTYASYLGGNGLDEAVGLAVDLDGAMYVTGGTDAEDFPTTAGTLQPTCPQAQPGDGCYYDMFVAKIAATGERLVYSTYLTSDDLRGLDYPAGIAVDAAGYATVLGTTASERWPTKDPVQAALNAFPCPSSFQDRLCFDSVLTTLTPDGQLAFSSYLGGTLDEESGGVALGDDGSIYLVGTTSALDYPTTAGVVQPAAFGPSELFLAHIARGTVAPPPIPNERVYLPLLQY